MRLFSDSMHVRGHGKQDPSPSCIASWSARTLILFRLAHGFRLIGDNLCSRYRNAFTSLYHVPSRRQLRRPGPAKEPPGQMHPGGPIQPLLLRWHYSQPSKIYCLWRQGGDPSALCDPFSTSSAEKTDPVRWSWYQHPSYQLQCFWFLQACRRRRHQPVHPDQNHRIRRRSPGALQRMFPAVHPCCGRGARLGGRSKLRMGRRTSFPSAFISDRRVAGTHAHHYTCS